MRCGDGTFPFPFPGCHPALSPWLDIPTAAAEQRSRASLRQDSRAGTDSVYISAGLRDLQHDSENEGTPKLRSPTQAPAIRSIYRDERISPKVRAYQILICHPFVAAFFACLMSSFILRQGFFLFLVYLFFFFFNNSTCLSLGFSSQPTNLSRVRRMDINWNWPITVCSIVSARWGGSMGKRIPIAIRTMPIPIYLYLYLYIAVKITFPWPGVNHSCARKTQQKKGEWVSVRLPLLPVPRNVDYINMPKRRRRYYEYSFVRDYGAY